MTISRCFACGVLLFACLLRVSAWEKQNNPVDDAPEGKAIEGSPPVDGFINLKVAHERDNGFGFGPKNGSMVGATPVIGVGDSIIFENDFSYGRLFAYGGYLKGARHLSKITADENFLYFRENFSKGSNIKKSLEPASANSLDRAHFYRNYSRIVYANKSSDYRVVVGDATARNTIGFQQPLSGGGVSIFRQSGNGGVVNAGSPIVITRVAKIECKIGDEVIGTGVFAPGTYYIDDLPEEAKLPGVTLKINDQLNRTENLKVDYFGGYGMLAKGLDDFDLTVVCSHKWDLEDPHRVKYQKKPRYSGNYRYGYADDVTVGAGLQLQESCCLLDYVMIFDTKFGKIAPNVGYGYGGETSGSKGAVGAGVFYAMPENDFGVHLEIFAAMKGANYGDLGKAEERNAAYNDFMDKYFGNEDLKRRFRNGSGGSSTRQITARLYTKPVFGLTPAFIFNGEWSRSKRLREYTLGFSTVVWECCTITCSSGLTYDDPFKGRNLRSPDRRFTLVCTVKIGTDLSVSDSYQYYDEEKRRSYLGITYTPQEIKGLELCAERTVRPGLSNPCFSVKYDGEFFNLKAEESVTNTYEDKEAGTGNKHSNRQRLYGGVSLSRDGCRAFRKNNFNVLRNLKD
ncbi:MAG: hypothetical protein LBB63_04155 [Holosporaceae bacterium]|jgi:outer membrane usher protein FimD/PapC|nr:hypothetical protein [Holosporaceae bacterium]